MTTTENVRHVRNIISSVDAWFSCFSNFELVILCTKIRREKGQNASKMANADEKARLLSNCACTIYRNEHDISNVIIHDMFSNYIMVLFHCCYGISQIIYSSWDIQRECFRGRPIPSTHSFSRCWHCWNARSVEHLNYLLASRASNCAKRTNYQLDIAILYMKTQT